MKEKISLAGDLGSGKSTVSKILIERLGAQYYSTGAIVRSIAEERGMTVVELNRYMEDHPEIDHEIDEGVARLAELDDCLIIDSRMAWHFTKGTFKVYLSTDIETSALRIMGANRKGEHALTLEETVNDTRRRRESEIKRYSEQYGVNIKDLTNYDLIVDTTYATPEEIAECIIGAFAAWCEDKSYKSAFISPERLHYPDDEADAELIAALCAKLESGESIPAVEIAEKDGEFYVISGTESALAHAFGMETFIPAVLRSAELDPKSFVRMKNSI
jgi:cytidylate kinase